MTVKPKRKAPKKPAGDVYVLKSSIARNRHERERDEAAAQRLALEAEMTAIKQKAEADADAILQLAIGQVTTLRAQYDDLHIVEQAAIAALISMEEGSSA